MVTRDYPDYPMSSGRIVPAHTNTGLECVEPCAFKRDATEDECREHARTTGHRVEFTEKREVCYNVNPEKETAASSPPPAAAPA